MAYEILDKQTSLTTTVWTLVKFDFLEDAISIPHINPANDEEIIKGIENREISERNNLLIVE